MTGFASTPFVRWLIIAIFVHVIVIGAFSTRYLYHTAQDFIDPAGAQARQMEREALAKAAREKDRPVTEAPTAPGDATPASPADATTDATATSETTTEGDQPADGIPDDKREAPVVKDTTSLPTEGEIPDAPLEGDTLLNIDDTN